MKTVQKTNFPADPFVSNINVVSQAIMAARTQAGMRMDEAALLCGVSLQTYCNVEAGSPGVSIGKILKIADALGVCLFVAPASEREGVRTAIAKRLGGVA